MVCERPMLMRVTMHAWSNTNRTWNTPLFTLMIEGLIGIEFLNGVAAECLIKHSIERFAEIKKYDTMLDGSIKHRNRRTNYYMSSMLAWPATILQDFGEADQMKIHVAFLNQQFMVTRSSRWYSISEQPFWTSIHLRILNQSFKVEGNQNGAGVPEHDWRGQMTDNARTKSPSRSIAKDPGIATSDEIETAQDVQDSWRSKISQDIVGFSQSTSTGHPRQQTTGDA